ncbi:RTA1-domain-containing protein [Pluteus cervinus]|uniref:RTA1-domain-containing protein n=1 Tax=Pluteus cervinus TaxID=181527 RepID=A0ACD3AL29_9AGAR|nr:RTA1-domain-containing protein [Pluteus cervinus]
MSSHNTTAPGPIVIGPHGPVHTPYGYLVNESIAILFVVLFSVSTLAHTIQAIRSRIWWLLPTIVFTGIMEIVGWSGRLWSSLNQSKFTPYEIQITATILAPTPLLAANFVILGRIISKLGPAYSRLTPRRYAMVFITFDVVALIVQAVGGGMAATAVGKHTSAARGGHIMLGGIAFQLLSIAAFAACAIEFFLRFIYDRPLREVENSTPIQVESKPEKNSGRASITTNSSAALGPNEPKVSPPRLSFKMSVTAVALLVTTACLLIRAVYRTIELSDGFTGKIIRTQIWFNIFDGGMVVFAMYTMNFLHPYWFLRFDDAVPRQSTA